MRAFSRQSRADVAPPVWTPKRNLRSCAITSRQSCDHRRELLHHVDADDDVAHLPALAPRVQVVDHLLERSHEDDGRLERLLGRDSERCGHHLGHRGAVVGEVHEAGERLDLEVVEPVAGGVAEPATLLVGRRSGHRLRGVVADRHAAAQVGVDADDGCLPAATARILGPPPPMMNGGCGCCTGLGSPSRSVTV